MKMKNKISNLNWTWFWSGNWPLLDALTERDESFQKDFFLIAGTYPEISVDFFEDGILTAYHCNSEYDRLKKHFFEKFNEDPSFIHSSFKDFDKRTNADIQSLQRINSLKLNELSNEALIEKFVHVRSCYAYISAMDHYAWYIEKFFVPKLQSIVEKKLDQKFVASAMAALVTPNRQSRIYKERKAFYEIATYAKSLGLTALTVHDMKSLLDENESLKSLLNNHLKMYNYLPVLVNNPPTSIHDLWEELVFFVNNDETFKIESKRIGDNYDEQILLEKKQIIEKLQPDDLTLKLIRGLEEAAFVRTEDNAVMSLSSYLVIPLYNEISRRLGITYSKLKELKPSDVITFLAKNETVPESFIEKRLKLTCHIVLSDEHITFTGNDAFEIKKVIESKIFSSKFCDLKGTPASLGKTSGRAYVATSSKEALDISKGDILIAPATSADFVPAMRKAGAIVTEFGGITSHAAIVSREFGIPCIVGVKNITKKIKSGTLIEIDADNGQIHFLNPE